METKVSKQNILEQRIEHLTSMMEKLSVVAPVAPVLPVLPVAPVAPVLPLSTVDHDILNGLVITVNNNDKKMEIRFEDVKAFIASQGDGQAKRVDDHETRIRKDETDITRIKSYGTALVFAVGLIEFLVSRILK